MRSKRLPPEMESPSRWVLLRGRRGSVKERITSKQLAKLVGVSSATISRAFSPNARISEQTRLRVLAMAEQYGYQPNAIARRLNNRRSRLVAVVVNTIGHQCKPQQLEGLVHDMKARGRVSIIVC